jgi:hypothetical protein
MGVFSNLVYSERAQIEGECKKCIGFAGCIKAGGLLGW